MPMYQPPTLLRQLPKRWLPWVAGAVLALVLVLGTARWLVDQQLAANGEEEGENWVSFVLQGVPSLEEGLRMGRFGDVAREQLRLLSTADEVFRFRLLNQQGRLVVDSRTLGAPEGAPLPAHADDALALTVLADGRKRVRIYHDDAEGIEGVEHYCVALLPIVVDGRRIGVFEVFIDQSERAEGLERAFLLL